MTGSTDQVSVSCLRWYIGYLAMRDVDKAKKMAKEHGEDYSVIFPGVIDVISTMDSIYQHDEIIEQLVPLCDKKRLSEYFHYDYSGLFISPKKTKKLKFAAKYFPEIIMPMLNQENLINLLFKEWSANDPRLTYDDVKNILSNDILIQKINALRTDYNSGRICHQLKKFVASKADMIQEHVIYTMLYFLFSDYPHLSASIKQIFNEQDVQNGADNDLRLCFNRLDLEKQNVLKQHVIDTLKSADRLDDALTIAKNWQDKEICQSLALSQYKKCLSRNQFMEAAQVAKAHNFFDEGNAAEKWLLKMCKDLKTKDEKECLRIRIISWAKEYDLKIPDEGAMHELTNLRDFFKIYGFDYIVAQGYSQLALNVAKNMLSHWSTYNQCHRPKAVTEVLDFLEATTPDELPRALALLLVDGFNNPEGSGVLYYQFWYTISDKLQNVFELAMPDLKLSTSGIKKKVLQFMRHFPGQISSHLENELYAFVRVQALEKLYAFDYVEFVDISKEWGLTDNLDSIMKIDELCSFPGLHSPGKMAIDYASKTARP
ncbi:MAG: hypothetical protein M1338_05415 [Patescibacteria group bacterium]|nr:hypothetical protein [Patescibacteria group bacterium]